jgi:hypothetical protein
MLALLSLFALILLLFIHLTGLALVGRRLLPNYLLAKCASPVLLCLVLFCVEHFVGLGDLAWLELLTTPLFVWLIWRDRGVLRAHWATELLFLSGFSYALFWGFCFPDLGGQSEKLTDLTFIANYRSGAHLPPLDHWFPPERFDVYYGFQYYSSALLGRILQLDLGTTYRLSFCVIVALTITAAGGAAYLLGGRRRRSLLPLAALVFGGTGASLVVPFMVKSPLLSDGMRFIGGSAVPERVATGWGRWLLAVSHAPKEHGLQLPAETFGYLLQLGDHHPPMSGFLLLALALLCIAIVETESELRAAPAVAAATVPMIAVANAWNLPLQALLVAGWIVWRLLRRVTVPWTALAAGAGAGLLLVHPFLMGFAWRSIDYGVRFRLVPGAEHTPPLLGLILFAPFLLLLAAGAFAGRRTDGALAWCLFWTGLFIFTEVFYADDVYSGMYNRFNSTLKWWPWIMAGMVITVGPLVLQARHRFSRWVGAISLLLVTGFAVPLAQSALRTPKPHIGRIDGAAWIISDVAEKPIFEFLKRQPPCIVLQRLEADAFTPAPGLIIHSGQTAFLGWPAHERLWRGSRSDIQTRSAQVKQFYQGEMADSPAWLLENKIEHVLWLKTELGMPAGTFDKIDAQIHSTYLWREYYRAGDFRVGVWSRRQYPAIEKPASPPVPATPAL